jgi:putative membrane protein
VLIAAILWVVLAKPHIDSNMFAAHLFEPGGLSRLWHQSFGDTRMPMP